MSISLPDQFCYSMDLSVAPMHLAYPFGDTSYYPIQHDASWHSKQNRDFFKLITSSSPGGSGLMYTCLLETGQSLGEFAMIYLYLQQEQRRKSYRNNPTASTTREKDNLLKDE